MKSKYITELVSPGSLAGCLPCLSFYRWASWFDRSIYFLFDSDCVRVVHPQLFSSFCRFSLAIISVLDRLTESSRIPQFLVGDSCCSALWLVWCFYL